MIVQNTYTVVVTFGCCCVFCFLITTFSSVVGKEEYQHPSPQQQQQQQRILLRNNIFDENNKVDSNSNSISDNNNKFIIVFNDKGDKNNEKKDEEDDDNNNDKSTKIRAIAQRLFNRWEDPSGRTITIARVFKHAFRGVTVTGLAANIIQAMMDDDSDNMIKMIVPNTRIFTYANETTETDMNNWGLDRINQVDLPLDETYTYGLDGSPVTVYVLDTGIRVQHREFGNRASCGYDSTSRFGRCWDIFNHGTPVAGVIGGLTDGVAKNVKLISVKVLDYKGQGTSEDMIDGIEYVIQQKKSKPNTPMVINISSGGPLNAAVNLAADAAVAAGIIVVAAAGNDGGDACSISPASSSSVITVASTTISDTKSSSSNYGECVDIFAPGDQITSASSWSIIREKIMSGTSFAAPHVSGVAALYLHQNPALTPDEVYQKIIADATKDKITNIAGLNTPNLLLNKGNL